MYLGLKGIQGRKVVGTQLEILGLRSRSTQESRLEIFDPSKKESTGNSGPSKACSSESVNLTTDRRLLVTRGACSVQTRWTFF